MTAPTASPKLTPAQRRLLVRAARRPNGSMEIAGTADRAAARRLARLGLGCVSGSVPRYATFFAITDAGRAAIARKP